MPLPIYDYEQHHQQPHVCPQTEDYYEKDSSIFAGESIAAILVKVVMDVTTAKRPMCNHQARKSKLPLTTL